MNKYILGLVLIVVVGSGVYLYINKGASMQKEEQKVEQETESEEVEQQVDKEVQETTDEATMEDETTKEFTIKGSNFTFDVKEMKVKKGDTVKITFVNEDGMHDWVVDEFNVRTKVIQTGQSETVEFVADKTGTFEYYCSVGKHRANGMFGSLIVE